MCVYEREIKKEREVTKPEKRESESLKVREISYVCETKGPVWLMSKKCKKSKVE